MSVSGPDSEVAAHSKPSLLLPSEPTLNISVRGSASGQSLPEIRRFAKRAVYRLITERRMQSATIPVISTSLRRLMPLQEGARAVDGAGLQLRRLLPGEHGDLRVRAERGDVD